MMETFDQLLEQALLELGVMDRVRQVGGVAAGAVAHKIAQKKDGALASIGSKSAVGRMNLRDQEKKLAGDFRVYCAEQKISPSIATMDDFLEFCRYRVGFNPPEDKTLELVYQSMANGEPQHEAQIDALTSQIEAGLHNNADIGPLLQQIQPYASQKNADGVHARRALWTLARANPGQIGKFRPIMNLVGRPIGGNLPRLITTIAQLVLKHGDSKAASSSSRGKAGATGRSGSDNENLTPDDLDVGHIESFDKDEFRTDGWSYPPLVEQLRFYGLDTDVLRGFIKKAAKWDIEKAKEGAVKLDRKFTKAETINLTRVLLQTFKGNTDNLQEWFDAYKGTVPLENEVKRLLSARPIRDGSTFVYDGTAMNKALSKAITEEATAANMLMVLLHVMRNHRILRV